MKGIKGAVALAIGGSSGIGRAASETFGREGEKVVIAREKLQENIGARIELIVEKYDRPNIPFNRMKYKPLQTLARSPVTDTASATGPAAS
ncbi:MAG: hypothetical protein ACLQMF_02205 [Rectinemataceae bacterium]